MSCLNPTEAWQDLHEFTKNGKHPVIFSYRDLDSRFYDWRYDEDQGEFIFLSDRYRPLSLACGKCVLCRKSRAWEVTVRALLEWQANPLQKCCFITLTVSDDHLEETFPGGILRHRPWQLFAKRLRKKIGSFRYLMCGEYGEKSRRPHYHAIIYGHDFTDRTWNYSDGSFCDSPFLSQVWSLGQVQCRSVNSNAIAYVAGYQLKLDDADIEDYDDGIHRCEDLRDFHFKNYVKWSRMPGLGYPFLEQHPDLFRIHDSIYDDGSPCKLMSPSIVTNGRMSFFDGRYFKKILERCANDPNFVGKIDENLRLILADKFGKLTSLTESRVLGKLLHGSRYVAMVKGMNLKNRADLYEVQLARKSRDIVA